MLIVIFMNHLHAAESNVADIDEIEMIEKFPSGQILTQGFKAKDSSGKYTVYVGKWTQYYETGGILATRTFASGLQEGYTRFYYHNGTLSSETKYVHGIRQGPSRNFFENGAIEGMENFKDDKVDGEWKEFWPNGELSRWGIYSAGRLTGPTYCREGTNGKVHQFLDIHGTGDYVNWFANGILHSMSHYEDGLLNGVNKIPLRIDRYRVKQWLCPVKWCRFAVGSMG
jgi:antitoxin component YwqK of YwqJK toxin-antitoxin module